jgi:hypothetical protein
VACVTTEWYYPFVKFLAQGWVFINGWGSKIFTKKNKFSLVHKINNDRSLILKFANLKNCFANPVREFAMLLKAN